MNSRIYLFCLGLLGALCLTGCGSVAVMRMTSANAPPKPPDCQLEIFGSEADIKRPFEVLCLIESKTGGTIFDRHSVEAALEQLRPVACKYGADALLLIDMNKEGPMDSFSSGWGRAMVKAKAIRWTKP